jgi:hypothetical protein
MTSSAPISDIPAYPPTGHHSGVPRPEKRPVCLHGHRLVYRIGGGEVSDERPALVLIHGLVDSSGT